MKMKNPPHPGELIRESVIEPLGLSVRDAADALRVTRQALSNLLNRHSSLSVEMAIRIEKAFGPRREHLLRMQHAYDIAQAAKKGDEIEVPDFKGSSLRVIKVKRRVVSRRFARKTPSKIVQIANSPAKKEASQNAR